MILNSFILLVCLFLSSCITVANKPSYIESFKSETEAKRNAVQLLLKERHEYIYYINVVNENGTPIEGAKVSYYIKSGVMSEIPNLPYSDSGYLSTDTNGLILYQPANNKSYMREEESKICNIESNLKLANRIETTYYILYKIEKEGFRPIISHDKLSFSSSNKKVTKKETLIKIKPGSDMIQDGLTFTMNQLPKNYKGYDIIKLKRELEQIGSDIEDDVYCAKWQDLYMSILHDLAYSLGSKKKIDIIAAKTCYAIKIDGGINDSGEIVLNTKGNKYIVKDLNTKHREYWGANVFGLVVKVNEYSRIKYSISPINYTKVEKNKRMVINGLAESTRKNIGVLFICKPFRYSDKYAFVTSSGSGHIATIDYPTTSGMIIYNINVELYEIWLYNEKTGEIYLKHKLS